jgi:hypothetical protein
MHRGSDGQLVIPPMRTGAVAGALGGVAAAAVFGVAHGVFLTWVIPPVVAAAAMGSSVGALCGIVMSRSGHDPSPLRTALLMMTIAIPHGVAAFVIAPRAGDGSTVVYGALVADVITGAMVGRAIGHSWWSVLAFAAIGAVLGGPGEPFIHEGPKPRIVGFYAGLVLALGTAGFVTSVLLPRGTRMRAPTSAIPIRSRADTDHS